MKGIVLINPIEEYRVCLSNEWYIANEKTLKFCEIWKIPVIPISFHENSINNCLYEHILPRLQLYFPNGNTLNVSQIEENGITEIYLCGIVTSSDEMEVIQATFSSSSKRSFIINDCFLDMTHFSQPNFFPEVTIDEFTNNFEVFCEKDTFILNDVFPPDIYTEDTFTKLINECRWKTMAISGGTLSRLIDIQGIRDSNGFIPVYRNPNDKYIEADEPTETLKSMFDFINDHLYLDGFVFNHVFLKYYQKSSDGIGRHSDKTLDLMPHSYIINLSLGATRVMTFTSKLDPSHVQTVTMKSNSCLVIGMKTNQRWLHEVKPDHRPMKAKTPEELLHDGQRMSFTFRVAGTFFDHQRQRLIGLGAPTYEEPEDLAEDRSRLVKAFSEENRRADFSREEFYGNGFWAMCT